MIGSGLPSIKSLMRDIAKARIDSPEYAWSLDPTVRPRGYRDVAIPRCVDAQDRPTCHRCPLFYACPVQLIGPYKTGVKPPSPWRAFVLRLFKGRPEESLPVSYRGVVPSDKCPVWYEQPNREEPSKETHVQP